jgi:site-specific DNA recombinase
MNAPVNKLARCAIYTRKSTEYNLELAFNSLDAQREACEAYIKSQAHEGWRLIPARYDDGAFSGASLERPALQRLLADVRAGKIEIVLVYKVDRLTRSLADFAKLIELFDAHGVFFVSVTQSFNTSSSMGRLTLNVLLSFAQFERELIGERVRDKIAASKRKGLWVGGPVPLGYAAVDKKILVVAAEAAAVRTIFARYLELGSIRAVAQDLDRQGIRSKPRRLSNGRTIGGGRFGVVRAFVPLVAGILRMSPRQFYAANILSALAWAPAHVFPGVLLAMAISLAGASAEQLTGLIIAALIVVSAACWLLPRAVRQMATRS